YAIMGHSMGCLVALLGTLQGAFTPQRMVLSSPLLRLQPYPFPLQITTPLSNFLTSIGFGKTSTGGGSYHKQNFATNMLTHDIHMFEVIKNSPYTIPSASFGWVHATIRA